MNFETGKNYQGYTVEARTKCFVKFAGLSRKKITISNDGVECVFFDELSSIVATNLEVEEVEIKSVEASVAETFFIPVVTMYDNRTVKNLPAAVAHEMATPYKAPQVAYSEVEVMAASLGYSVLNMGTLKKPMYRLMRDGLLIDSSLYGMGLALFDVQVYLEAERHAKRFNLHVESVLEKQIDSALGVITVVIKDIPQCGYAVAVKAFPEWFYDDDNAHEFNIDVERARMSRIWDRDCDRVADFGMSAKYGEGAVI